MKDTFDDFSRLSLEEIAGNRVKLLNRIQQHNFEMQLTPSMPEVISC